MIRFKQLALFAVVVELGQTICVAHEVVVLTNELQASYSLKVGYATFDSVASTRSSPAFAHLTEQLKLLCTASRHTSPTGGVGESNNWRRPIDADIAFGSDYQILNWLRSARIDAAMLSPMSLRLFDASMTNVVYLASPDGSDCTFVYRPKVRSFAFSHNEWVHCPNPEADYETFLQSIAQPAGSGPSNIFRLVAPSHFSAAGFIAPIAYAKRWLQNFAASTNSTAVQMNDRFWQSFFAHLEFSLGDPRTQTSRNNCIEGTILIEFSTESSNDDDSKAAGWANYTNTNCILFESITNVLVARNDVMKKVLVDPFRNNQPVPVDSSSTVEAFFADEDRKQLVEPRFTIGELLTLLRQDQALSGQEELTLVLSGGGVKAAYQSMLIDYLYSTNLLSNSTNPPAMGLRVKSIVGNSGGALLGFFVAGLKENDPRKLSEILWMPSGRLLTDRAIFGWFDLPRWASFVVCVWVFIAVLRLCQRMKDLHDQPPQAEEAGGLPWLYRITVILLLVLTPILVLLVNGEYGIEHVPEIEGFFYFVCLFFMLFIDNCVVTAPVPANALKAQNWNWFNYATVVFALGIASAAALVRFRERAWLQIPLEWRLTHSLIWSITRASFGFCCAILICWVALILWILKQPRYRLYKTAEFFLTVSMTIGIIGLTYLTILLLECLGQITFLELTFGFWKALILLTVVWSLLYFLVSTSKKCPEWLRKFPSAAYEYQRSRYPHGMFGFTRLVRIHLTFTFGFYLWNVVVAPAIYGNKQAHQYLVEATDRFVASSGGTTNEYHLQTLYACPANDLGGNCERYFFFYPNREDLSNTVTSIEERLNNDVRKRWKVQAFSNPEDMQKVVFASGSPFPIFPPHLIKKERLVDGGYAHNVPLEAARQIGARQVIVLNSSPADDPEQPDLKTRANKNLFTQFKYKIYERVFGQLTHNILRLLPFLYQQSQVADFLSQEDMFIVSLSPDPTNNWPSLFDFRRSTVSRMLSTARQDTTNRIGHIESYGLPSFRPLIRIATDQE